ncbi:hypothetical protein EH165_12400 [Nakamurella antarctica]|uniref:SMI1/KNR4 family protein n=1 Tax=Nakamurella antarctica TaxID=1902245 RepID=A0A3G8ZPU9_9ACTN|nr:hypothetical protein [Nakamurella antarctica]AZI58817.1 hypothetical protein EH165_12400 [Nakamurella antarctica]
MKRIIKRRRALQIMVMEFDNTKAGWRNLVGFLIILKRQILEFENPSLIGDSLPELGATSEELEQYSAIYANTPFEFNEWIRQFNGWHEVYFSFSLLPLSEIKRASEAMESDVCLEVALEFEPDFDPDLLFVVGSSPDSGARLLVSADPTDPRAYWFGDGDVETFPSFIYAFNFIVMLHQGTLEDFKSGKTKPFDF